MQKRINVRRRIVVASAICSLLLFVFTTPIVSGLISFILPPASLKNVRIIQSIDTVTLSWDTMENSTHIKSYILTINERIEEITKETVTFSINQNDTFVDNSNSVTIAIQAVDYLGRLPQPILFELSRITEDTALKTFEETKGLERTDSQGQSALALSVIISVALSISATWIFQFKLRKPKEFILIGYMGAVNFSYLFLALSLLFSSEVPFSRFILSVILAVSFYVLFYLTNLTVNILYNSLSYELPLEQAAKAAQFIFSLIAAYLLLIIFFGSEYGLTEKTLLVAFFVGYYTLSSIAMLKNIRLKDVLWRSLSITMVIIFAIFIISIWPIHYIYGILAIAVIYYILLSISLENRHTLTKYTWVEYSALLSLVFALFVLTSNWGINGTLL